jgi:arsenate reductase-like glutaredoxin family protein
MNNIPILYIKPGCPWCREAQVFFGQHGVEVDVKDVLSNKSHMQRMVEISSQALTPTFEYNDFVVADFSTNEFISELEQRPDIKTKLGLGEEDDF